MHEAASVPPATFVRYLPALHAVQTVAPLAENHPLWHCTRKKRSVTLTHTRTQVPRLKHVYTCSLCTHVCARARLCPSSCICQVLARTAVTARARGRCRIGPQRALKSCEYAFSFIQVTRRQDEPRQVTECHSNINICTSMRQTGIL